MFVIFFLTYLHSILPAFANLSYLTSLDSVAQVPEELLHNVMKCLTVLMLNVDERVRKKLLRSQVPLIAQAVFVSVHIAKLHKLRALRLVF